MQKRGKAAEPANTDAIETLYAEHRSSLVAYAARLLRGNRAAAEDAVQDAFVAIWREADVAQDRANMFVWMKAIVRHKAIDGWRKSQRLVQASEAIEAQIAAIPDPLPLPDEIAEARQLTWHLRASIERLPVKQRQAIHLHYFEFARISQIAAIDRCSGNTVKTRLHYGRLALGSCAALH